MPSLIHIRPAVAADAETWLRLRCTLWPDGADDHAPEIAAFFAMAAASPEETANCAAAMRNGPDPAAVFLAECDGQAVALLELSFRFDLAPLPNQKVAYIEGLYIVPQFRGQALARLLLRRTQAWAREHHCQAIASDREKRPKRIVIAPGWRLE